MEAQITLAQAIRELRTQLSEIALEADDASVRFIPKSVEVELSITFDVEGEVGGGFKLLSLIDFSAKAKRGDTSAHRIKLTLEPIGADGKPYIILDKERESR